MELHRVGGCSSRVIYIHPIKIRLTSRSFPSEEKEEKGPGFRDLHICDILLIGNRKYHGRLPFRSSVVYVKVV